MAKETKTLTAQLGELHQAEVRERAALRDADLAAQQARAAVGERREARVEAVAEGSPAAIEKAAAAHRRAEAEAGESDIAAEGAARRVERAERERKQFETTHAGGLIAEL